MNDVLSMHAVSMRTMKTLKTSRCCPGSALVHGRNKRCVEEDTVSLPAPLSLMKEAVVLIVRIARVLMKRLILS